jgi:hypothetical protein
MVQLREFQGGGKRINPLNGRVTMFGIGDDLRQDTQQLFCIGERAYRSFPLELAKITYSFLGKDV